MRRILCKQLILLVLLSATFCAKAFADADASNGATYYMYSATIDASGSMQPGNGGVLDKNRIRIINLGPVNSGAVDYAPTISADGRTLFFVSGRNGSKIGPDGKPSHDFWAAKKNDRLDTVFADSYNIDPETHEGNQGVNTPLGEGAASIAADKQSLFFTGCNREDGLGSCDIYRTTIEGDQWGRPVNLGPNVNSKYFDSQPTIAPDQSRIYFVSTRPGPNSDGENRSRNFDIWFSDWDEDAEEWRPAQNLTQLNTEGEDVSPFIAADNASLFFASDGHKPNYGKKDFYVARYDAASNHWSKPENLGTPINTDEDEMFISLPASGDIIYFSSKREDLPGYQGNLDLFMAFVPTFFRAVNVVGTVIDECSGEFIPAAVTIRNPITGRVVRDSLSNAHTDFEFVVSNTDYGNPKDSIKFVDLEITAENSKYTAKSIVQRIMKPGKTDDPEEAKKFADEVKVKFTLGQRPQIATDIAEADYVRRYKSKRTEIAGFSGLVMEQVATWDLYPLLNYVFFEAGSSVIPKRYNLFKDPSQTAMFTDTTIAGGTLNKYYHLLNIYGFRMKKYPAAKIEIVGTTDDKTPEEKRAGLSKERADNVYNYLKNVWKIEESRMKLTYRNAPLVKSNPNDSLGIVENRRVEILCDDWNVMQPVFDRDPKTFPQPDQMTFKLTNGIEDAIVDKRRVEIKHGTETWATLDNIGTRDGSVTWDWTNIDGKYPKDELPYTAQLIVTTKSGAECRSDIISIPVMQVSTEQKKVIVGSDSTLENYSLILFPFNSSDAGEINERIMREYVYERSKKTSSILVTGHTDVVGLYDHNKKLSERRAQTVQTGINRQTGGKIGYINVRGVGEDEPLYDNALPEGRFYNRTVNVIIRTPVEEYQDQQ